MRRALALATLAALATVTLAAAWMTFGRPLATTHTLVIRDATGTLLARVRVERSGFALRYRNSLYGTLAEERFLVDDGRFTLVELAADERAVLEEYYEILGPARQAGEGDARQWIANPARTLQLTELAIAATDLGARTVLIPGSPPIELWRMVDDPRPTVVLSVERAGS